MNIQTSACLLADNYNVTTQTVTSKAHLLRIYTLLLQTAIRMLTLAHLHNEG